MSLLKVFKEVEALISSGYDGPLSGEAVESLFRAVRQHQVEREEDWEDDYADAVAVLERAARTSDSLASWSGASGNWTLQSASINTNKALKILLLVGKHDDGK